ncbi:phosphopantetheine-binding protein [Notoacmeibacter ruber]|nr:phosphopantetheine-binding protein [Notoacmeibacter ruber]
MSQAQAATTDPRISKQSLREQLSRFLDEEPEDDDNLMDFGLTSIGAMKLVSEWKAAGIPVSFPELASNPTIDGIWDLLQAKAPEPRLDDQWH